MVTSIIPCDAWIEDWLVGVKPKEEAELGKSLILVFSQFWNAKGLDDNSKNTKYRYSCALHSLGGYLIEQIYDYEMVKYNNEMTTEELLLGYIDADGGPLIHHNENAWQREVDAVCKKLYKYLSVGI
ncbi:MAG: hypothetical protein JRI67_10435 [Deltaproteobacteria bacterium]|nr:hypothetical protein [Deltaproteobacteria bacterium]